MATFDQGSHENINYYLFTTGFNIDPRHGGMAEVYYNHLKTVIQDRAEIVFENEPVRQVTDINPNEFLQGYPNQPRTVYQWLFGTAMHSDGWTCDTLTQAIDSATFPRNMLPDNGTFSLEFDNSWRAGFTLYKNIFNGVENIWVEYPNFFYSTRVPNRLEGDDGDVWLANNNGVLELWYKHAFQWEKMSDHVKDGNPEGQVFFQEATPPNQSNSWWLDTAGLVVRKYNQPINIWAPPATVFFNQTGPFAEGDVRIDISEAGVWKINEYTATGFKPSKFASFEAQDRGTNTTFNGQNGQNNFYIECDQVKVFTGSPIEEQFDLRIKKDGVLIETFVDSINFAGPDFEVTVQGSGEVKVEHLPVTSLEEQSAAPITTTDTGKIFTLEVDGITELFYLDDLGNVTQLSNNGSTPQNVKLFISSGNAIAGQTVFSVPPTTKAVITVKVNGVDTTAWTYTHPSVTYNPVNGGYFIQSGDVVSVIYYE